MQRLLPLTILVILTTFLVGCASGTKHHKSAMPDPKSFNAHFGDMDVNGNDLVNQEEFRANFKNDNMEIFKALDLNQDDSVDHDEWHKFKKAHGLKHKE